MLGFSTQTIAEWSGEVGLEGRWHMQSPVDPAQYDKGLSLSFESEYSKSWDGGNQSFVFKPFLRLDQIDDKRTHVDIREAVWIKAGDDWEFRLGIDKVYWGVTEANHLVDIINQTDQLENPDGEQKLGQAMIKFSTERDWGTVDAYFLPWFRERQFAGNRDRLRSQPRVDASQTQYENDLEQHYPDLALRWSHSVGDWDLGLSHFHGTSREPSFSLGTDGSGNSVLIPRYAIIDQSSLDVQATLDDWLWKLETIYRSGHGDSFYAATGGFEYTLVGIAETDNDLGILLELMYDDRGASATTPFNQDVFLGLRWVANDTQSTEVLGGVIVDWSSQSKFFNLEASRRFGDNWKASLQMRAWLDVPLNDLAFSQHRDDYIEAKLVRYF